MTLKIVMGAIAAFALAQTAQAQEPGATDGNAAEPQATDTNCPAYSPYSECAQTQTPSTYGQSTYGQSTYGQTQQSYEQTEAAQPEEQQEGERWRRPERRGWSRLLLPVDLAREGASALRHTF
jgi:hypothetical protein